MQRLDPESETTLPSTGDEPGRSAHEPPGGGSPPPDGPRTLLLAVGVGVAVGVLSWLVGEVAERTFTPKTVAATLRNGIKSQFITDRARSVASIRNVALSSGLFGALLGSALGLAGAAVRRDRGAGRRAGLIGLAAGAIAGVGAAVPMATLYYRSFEVFNPDGLAEPLLLHAGMWGPIGAAGGLAFGLGIGGRAPALKALAGGLAGAVLGAGIYEVVGATVFPLSRAFQPSAGEWPARLLARLMIAVLASAGAALSLTVQPRAKRAD